jgi:transposase
MAGKTKKFSDNFKRQIIKLRQKDVKVSEIARKYGISESTVYKWYNDYIANLCKAKDNKNYIEKELMRVHKQKLEESDILKQAAKIIGHI